MKLTPAEIEAALADLDGWTLDGNTIHKQFTFADFPAAIAFVNRVADMAEAADHHPDIHISYKRVTLAYSTHSAGGITEKDVYGARAADSLA